MNDLNSYLVRKVWDAAAANDEVERDLLAKALYSICDDVHACCWDRCPVYALMTEAERPNCKCFKNGDAMATFIWRRTRGEI